MRNYIKELHESGISYKELSSQTGISSKRLSAIGRGIKTVSSKDKIYQTIRNVNRRTAYKKLVDSGLSPSEANKYRRIGLSDKTYSHQTFREVAHTKLNTNMFQLKLLAEFENIKTKETRIIECFSLGHQHINIIEFKDLVSDIESALDEMSEAEAVEYDNSQELLSEAIRDGQSKLGGSNWELKRIIDIETITYKIG